MKQHIVFLMILFFFFFNIPAPPEFSSLPLPALLPTWPSPRELRPGSQRCLERKRWTPWSCSSVFQEMKTLPLSFQLPILQCLSSPSQLFFLILLVYPILSLSLLNSSS
uniref:Uncharacterized protein n=1 Tax=Cacopsylla melanoneura TaxID=428564 RepID=A0A8D8PXU6_9HEMI